MKSKNKGGVAMIVLCSILILLGLVVLIVSPVVGAIAVLGGIGGIIYGVKARKRYKVELKEAEEQKAAAEAERQRAAERRAQKIADFAATLDAIPRVDIEKAGAPAKRKQGKPYPKLANITARTDIQKLFPLVVVDVETTGLKPAGNDIIEVAAIKYSSPFVPESCFTTYCKPRNSIPAAASEVNHITDDMVEDAPTFQEIAASLSEYIKGCSVVGHNVEFDADFLFACGADLPETKYYDTLQLSRYVDKELPDHKLETVLRAYGILRNDAHRAISDAYATGLLFEKLVQEKRS